MRLGLLSTMAALLACNGLVFGQTEVIVSGQPGEFSSPSRSGLLAPLANKVQMAQPLQMGQPIQQVQATTVMPMPSVQPAPVAPAPIMPTVVNDYGMGSPPILDQRADSWLQEAQSNRNWFHADFILWRMGSAALPSGVGIIISDIEIPVFTKEIVQVNDPNAALVVSQTQVISATLVPATVTVDAGLPGGNSINFRDQPGVLIRAGHWFDEDQTCGVDFNAFFMWKRTIGLNADNNLNLSAPSGQFQTTRTTNIPADGGQNGGVPTTTTEQGPEVNITVNLESILRAAASNQVWGFDANLISRPVYFGPLTLDFLGGLRYLDIKQELVRDQLVAINPVSGQDDPNFPPLQTGTQGPVDGTANPLDYLTGDATVGILNPDGTVTYATLSQRFTDLIQAKSRFYGLQLGLAYDWEIGYGLYISGFGKVAIGDMHQQFILHSVGTGFLINPFDNNTEHNSDRICFVPEFNINFGYAFCPGVRVYAGWDIIHISSLAKVNSPLLVATNSSSLTINDTTTSGSTSSFGFNFASSKTNLQGLNIGAELRW